MSARQPTYRSDSETWQAMQAGQEEALRWLMRTFTNRMYHYGRKFSDDSDAVQDAIQEVFVQLWQQRQRLSLPDSVQAYLFTSLRRRIHRNRLKYRFESLDDAPEFLPFWAESPAEGQLIENETVTEQARIIAEQLNKLPARQREIIYLRYFQALTRDEIVQVMDISPQSVSNLLQKALISLRQLLSPDLFWMFLLLSIAKKIG